MSKVAYRPEDFRDAIKEFRGVIVDADYGLEPLGMTGAPEIEAKREQLCIKIDSPSYDKSQYEWYAPSSVKKTRWAYFIEALAKCGALVDISISGETEEERLKSFAKALIGMEFDWVELTGLEIVVKGKTVDILLPDVYHGRKEIKPVEEVRTEEVEL